MYFNGQQLSEDQHFLDHQEAHIPIQVYHLSKHVDIGFIEEITPEFVKLNDTFYHRLTFTFISRPGY